MRIYNVTRQTIVAQEYCTASTFFTRFMGLMGKKELPDKKALVIKPCNSIHTFFMRFPIDVLFVDRNNRITHVIESIKPWKVSKVVWNSSHVIELPPGTVKLSKTQIGDTISLDRSSNAQA